MAQPSIELTAEQIAHFREQGYVAIDAITTAEEVAALREVYDRLFSERAGREEGNQFDLAGPDEDPDAATLPQILNPAKYAPELNDTLLLANAQAIARQIFGDQAQAHFAHAIFKPAGHGAATPWHQDAAYWMPDMLYDKLSIWVPLQEATPENGCMHFAPGSNGFDVLPHRSIGDDPRVHGLELHADYMRYTEPTVACPLPAGGATLHDAYTLHYTPPNRSSIPRRALILDAGLPPRPRERKVRFPWKEEKRTARAERAAQAARAG